MSQIVDPDENFARNWSEHLDQPVYIVAPSTRPFDDGIAACHQVSAILACRGLQDMHPEEEKALSLAAESFDRCRKTVAEIAGRTGNEDWLLARDYLDATWGRVVGEYEALQAANTVADPLSMASHQALSGQIDDHTAELAAIRLSLFQSGSQTVASADPLGDASLDIR